MTRKFGCKGCSLVFVVLIIISLAVVSALGQGYIFPKWSADSLVLGFGLAIGTGAFMMGAIYFFILGLAGDASVQS